ncbi:hypothetical protein F4778DRAFT_776472 [Xylariomycetidae sp. FL2044]|nr:hypothetical protein F4778DRAFT_776472 [Xylariomycetidae sp. FL2044]
MRQPPSGAWTPTIRKTIRKTALSKSKDIFPYLRYGENITDYFFGHVVFPNPIRMPSTITDALGLANLVALAGATVSFARWHGNVAQRRDDLMDELESNLRGDIGLVEDALQRVE